MQSNLYFIKTTRVFNIFRCKYCTTKVQLPNILMKMLEDSKKLNEEATSRGVIAHRQDAQKQRTIRDGGSKFSVSKATLQVLGTAAPGTPKALYLFTDHNRYLFNCGEGMQRLAHEHKVKIARLNHIFFTSSTWSSIGGLPGAALTLQDVGVPKITLHGPPGLDDLFVATRKFIVLKDIAIEAADCSSGNSFEDSIMTMKYIELKRINPNNDESPIENQINYEADNTDYYDHEYSGKRVVPPENIDQILAAPKRTDFSSIVYVCHIKPSPGALDLQKCVDRKVPPGPLLGQLKSGQDITLPDGTIVYSKDVRHPDKEATLLIVMEIPDVHYLESLLNCEEFEQFYDSPTRKPLNIPNLIVHFTPDAIVKDPRYQTFLSKFGSTTKHLLLNDGNTCSGTVEPHRVQNKLNLLHDTIFPLTNTDLDTEENNGDVMDVCNNTEISSPQLIKGKTFTLYHLRPHTGFDHSQELKIDVKEYIAEAMKVEGFEKSLQKLKSDIESEQIHNEVEEYPKVIFFGTGSCIPNKTRNTSAIMVHTNENSCFLLDCGEGTYGQMVRFYGRNNIDKVMRQLKGVYVSHLHADHHLGFLGVLQGRQQAFNNDEYQPLYLFAPRQIMSWLALFHKRFERILDRFTLIPNTTLVENFENYKPVSEDVLHYIGLSSINTCQVKHCPNSFGVSIVTDQKKRLTYSGDTMPCDSLVNLGQDSDLLIHEATMEDDLVGEARAKMHSTTGQAIYIGEKMNAKFIILTHFSQRYARIPRLSPEFEEQNKNVGIAFDNMRVRFCDLPLLPKFYPCLKVMFADHFEELEYKAEKRAKKRERNRSLPGGENSKTTNSPPKEPKTNSKNSVKNEEILETIKVRNIENNR